MIEFEKPNITKIDENKDYGVFVVEPLERGYGTTLWKLTSSCTSGFTSRCSCHFNQH